MKNKPKVLLWDIETSLMKVSSFSLWPKYIPHDAILEDWHILCGAWKWLGERKVHLVKQAHYGDDREVTQKLLDAVSEADVIVHHNGDKFDIKKLNTRCIINGLDAVPPHLFSPKHKVDTLKAAKKYFGFTSNRLDYIAKALGYEGKLETHGLWQRLVEGDMSALGKMGKYNKQDVLVLEAVYKRLIPYIHNHPSMTSFAGLPAGGSDACSKCNSLDIQYRGWDRTAKHGKRRLKCNTCGSWSTSSNLIPIEDTYV